LEEKEKEEEEDFACMYAHALSLLSARDG